MKTSKSDRGIWRNEANECLSLTGQLDRPNDAAKFIRNACDDIDELESRLKWAEEMLELAKHALSGGYVVDGFVEAWLRNLAKGFPGESK